MNSQERDLEENSYLMRSLDNLACYCQGCLWRPPGSPRAEPMIQVSPPCRFLSFPELSFLWNSPRPHPLMQHLGLGRKEGAAQPASPELSGLAPLSRTIQALQRLRLSSNFCVLKQGWLIWKECFILEGNNVPGETEPAKQRPSQWF